MGDLTSRRVGVRAGGLELAATFQGQELLHNESERDNSGGAARDGRPWQQYMSLGVRMNIY